MSLRERNRVRTRELIVETALELFLRKGFDDTTVAEIGEACGISPRTFFRYFPTKEDVLFPDAAERNWAVVELLRRQLEELPPVDALWATLRAAALESYGENRRRVLARYRLLGTSTSLRAFMAEDRLARHDAVLATMRECADLKASDLSELELRMLTQLSTATVHAAVYLWLDEEAARDLGKLIDEAFGRLAKGLDDFRRPVEGVGG
ncbi:MAG: TetR family transcriptional regulator [Microbacterium sp.]